MSSAPVNPIVNLSNTPMSRRLARRSVLTAGAALLGVGAAACDVWSMAGRATASEPGGSPYSIEALRGRTYAGGEIRLHQVIERAGTHASYLFSYPSDGLRITGVAEIPTSPGPHPVVVLNHGFVLPAQYQSGVGTRAISSELVRRGILTLASDYRGLGGSEDDGRFNVGARLEYGIDVLNLVASLPSLPEARNSVVGMWGHSLGSDVSLRAALVSPVVQPVALWAPVSGWISDFADHYGIPTSSRTAELRDAMSPGNYLQFMKGPVVIHQGTSDRAVPPEWAQRLYDAMYAAGVPAEITMHPGLSHYLDADAQIVVQATADFFVSALLG